MQIKTPEEFVKRYKHLIAEGMPIYSDTYVQSVDVALFTLFDWIEVINTRYEGLDFMLTIINGEGLFAFRSVCTSPNTFISVDLPFKLSSQTWFRVEEPYMSRTDLLMFIKETCPFRW